MKENMKENMKKIYEKTFNICMDKANKNIMSIGDNLLEYMPTFDGKYFSNCKNSKPFAHIMTWMSSFFTAMSAISYTYNKDEKILIQLQRYKQQYIDKTTVTKTDTMHDIGFLYSLYSCAMYKITGDAVHLSTAIDAAKVLAERFVENGNYIKAWGRMDNTVPDYINKNGAKDDFFTKSDGLIIIDSMMNLPLLFFATEQTGDNNYKNIAIAHADTVLKNIIRDDGSVYHAFKFDTLTGAPLYGENNCGYSVESHWARGTAWAIYGFALAYSYTKYERYKEACIKISTKFIDCCNEEDKIPLWDFRLPKNFPAKWCGKPEKQWDETMDVNKKYNRDTSAAAIAICGFDEILNYVQNEKLEGYINTVLPNLCNNYVDSRADINGILTHSNGNMSYTNFGDYFFMEALWRKLHKTIRFW